MQHLAAVGALRGETRRLRGQRALLVHKVHRSQARLKSRGRLGASEATVADSPQSRTYSEAERGEEVSGARGVVSALLDISAISVADSLSVPGGGDVDSSDSSSDGSGGDSGCRRRSAYPVGKREVAALRNEIKTLKVQLFKGRREAQEAEVQLRLRLEREFAQQLAVTVAQEVEAALQQVLLMMHYFVVVVVVVVVVVSCW